MSENGAVFLMSADLVHRTCGGIMSVPPEQLPRWTFDQAITERAVGALETAWEPGMEDNHDDWLAAAMVVLRR